MARIVSLKSTVKGSFENELMVTRGERQGEGIVMDFGINMYTLLYLKWITNKVLLHSTGNSGQRYVPARWEGIFANDILMKVKVTQSCLMLCDPLNYIVHGIL